MFSTGTLQLSLTAWNQRLFVVSEESSAMPQLPSDGRGWLTFVRFGGVEMCGCSITASADGKMEFGLFGFTSRVPVLPCSGSCLAFELIHILLRLQRARSGNSLSTTWSSEVEGKAPREEFHSLKSRMCSWCCWKNSLMQQLCSVLSRDSRHSIRSHVILALGLIPNECSVVNALSATFALKGKSLVLRNFPHPVALFFLRGVIIAESKIQTCVSLGT